MSSLNNLEFLITGGTGSLGTTIVKTLKRKYKPHGIRIFSRDEHKQFHFRNELKKLGLEKNVAFLIGDVRDEKRLTRAMKNVDIVINTAALKHIAICNENPMEAIATNIQGAQNVITAALTCNIPKVMHISTDKNCMPINFYGATKMTAEMLCIHANVYHSTKFSCCRYGNVLGSRGSVIPLFREQAKAGEIVVTHKNMSRFWITLEDVTEFLLSCIQKMKGNEIFIPKMITAKVMDIAKIICPDCKIKITKPVPGEKIYETLIAEEESNHTIVYDDHFVINPSYERENTFSYTSDPENRLFSSFISMKDLEKKIESIK